MRGYTDAARQFPVGEAGPGPVRALVDALARARGVAEQARIDAGDLPEAIAHRILVVSPAAGSRPQSRVARAHPPRLVERAPEAIEHRVILA